MSSFQSLSKARANRLARNPIRPTQPSHQSEPRSSHPPVPVTPSSSPPSSTPPPPSAPPTLPPQLEIKTQPTKGRALWIKRQTHPPDNPTQPAPVVFKAGSTILSTTPHAASLSTASLRTVCSACFLNPHECLQIRSHQKKSSSSSLSSSSSSSPSPSPSSSSSSSSNLLGSREPPELTACAGCRVVAYCSPECQSTDRPDHQLECLALSSLQRRYLSNSTSSNNNNNNNIDDDDIDRWIPGEAVRALARLCAKRRRLIQASTKDNVNVNVKARETDSWWAQISGLDCQRSSMPLTDPLTGAPAPYAQLALQLGVYLGHALHSFTPSSTTTTTSGARDQEEKIPPAEMSQFGFETVAEVLDLCAAFMTNSFTLSSPSLTPIGVAISPPVALFNHSCWPNAVVVFPFGRYGSKGDGNCMDVIALRDLVQGEQIVTAYIDISLPAQLRQAELQNRYFFKCDCDLCANPSADPRQMVRPRQSYDGLEDWVLSGMKLLKMEQQGSLIDFDQLLTKASPMSVISSLAHFYPPWAYPLFPLIRLLSTLLVTSLGAHPETDRLDDSIRCALLVWESMSSLSIYPENHPVRALARAELGKLLVLPPSSSPTLLSPSPSPSPSALPSGLFDLARTTIESIPRDPIPRLILAQHVLLDALTQLRVAFGKPQGGLVGLEIAGLVEGVEREIEMLKRQSG